MNKKQAFVRLIVWLCVILTLCYPMISVLSYYHDCNGDECPVCHLVEVTKNILAMLTVTVAYIGAVKLINDFITDPSQLLYYKNANPILQGVKLSN